ncbi:MAG: hypothetical protein QXL18_03990 [Candidatus Woesearchaeota archaeon]
MKLKETGNHRILGYYKNNDLDNEWIKIQGDNPAEFITNLQSKINDKVIFHNEKIEYFEKLIPIPELIDEKTYETINILYNK